MTDRPRPLVLVAFAASVVMAGVNFVAVRFSNQELPPTWGAAFRFLLAAWLLVALMAARGIPVPRGRALVGAIVYGVLAFGGFFGLIYWGMVEVSAPVAVMINSTMPLLTVIIAVLAGVESWRWSALVGAILAVAGVAILFIGDGSAGAAPIRFLAVVVACLCFAAGGVAVKFFPPSHPAATNAVGMIAAVIVLLAASAAQGEAWVLPTAQSTWIAFAYLVAVSVVLFPLAVWIIQQWTASASAYIVVMSPLVTVPLAAWMLGEGIGGAYALAAAVIVAGVYFGALRQSQRPRAASREPAS